MYIIHDRTENACTVSTSRCPHTNPWKSFLRLCMGQREVLTVHAFSVLSWGRRITPCRSRLSLKYIKKRLIINKSENSRSIYRSRVPTVNTIWKLKAFRSLTLTINQIDNLDIPFNSPELLFFPKVNARYGLRIFVNSTAVTCCNKLSLISV